MLISLASLRNSPGVSAATLALAWTWPRFALAAECDPVGGQVLSVFDPAGSLGRRGMFEAMLASRAMPEREALWRQVITLPDGTGKHFLLPGARSHREAESLRWPALAAAFQNLDPIDVLADCGRLRSRGTPYAVLGASDLLVLVVRNDRHSLHTLASSVEVVREEVGVAGVADDGVVAVVVTGSAGHSFSAPEITRHLSDRGIPVLGELPWRPSDAAQFTDTHQPNSKFPASPLLAKAKQLGRAIGRHALARRARLREMPVPTQAGVQQREPVAVSPPLPVPRPPAHLLTREGSPHAR